MPFLPAPVVQVTRYRGNSAWIISDEMSMNSDTNPRVQTFPGISRH